MRVLGKHASYDINHKLIKGGGSLSESFRGKKIFIYIINMQSQLSGEIHQKIDY